MSPLRDVKIGDDGRELTGQEVRAIEALQKLARQWPGTLYLASMSGELHVMRKDADGGHAQTSTVPRKLDPEYSVDTVNIESIGGDW
jgi:hypothetical protein